MPKNSQPRRLGRHLCIVQPNEPPPVIDPDKNPLAEAARRFVSVPPIVLMQMSQDVQAYLRAHPEAVDTAALIGGSEDDLMWALLAQQVALYLGEQTQHGVEQRDGDDAGRVQDAR